MNKGIWDLYKGRIVGSLAGAVVGLFALSVGWKTLLFLVFAAIGYFLGFVLWDKGTTQSKD